MKRAYKKLFRFWLAVQNNKIASLIFVIFIFSRFFFIFYSPYAPMQEEEKQLTLGIHLLTGIRLPIVCYMQTPYGGGAFMDGFFLIPFLLIFGFDILASKMLAFTFSLGILCLGYRILGQFYHKKYALAFLVLFTFASPHFIQKNTGVFGNIIEPVFFISLSIYIFFSICLENDERIYKWFMLGFFNGFGIWIQYGQAPFAICIFLYLFVFFIIKVNIKKFFFLVSGFFLGLFPYLFYRWYTKNSFDSAVLLNDQIKFSFFDFKIERLPQIIAELILKFFVLILYDIPDSFHFLSFSEIDHSFLSAIYLSCWLFSFSYLVIKIVLFYSQKVLKSKDRMSLLKPLNNKYILKWTFFPVTLLVAMGMYVYFTKTPYIYNYPIELAFPKTHHITHGRMDSHFNHYEVFFHTFFIINMSLVVGGFLLSRTKLVFLGKVMLIIILMISSVGYVQLFPKISQNSYSWSYYGADLSVVGEYVAQRKKILGDLLKRLDGYPFCFRRMFLLAIAERACNGYYTDYDDGLRKMKDIERNLPFLSRIDKKYFLSELFINLEKLKAKGIRIDRVKKLFRI